MGFDAWIDHVNVFTKVLTTVDKRKVKKAPKQEEESTQKTSTPVVLR